MMVRDYEIDVARPACGSRLVYRTGCRPRALPCWMALPANPAPDAPPLVAVHGIQRGARDMAACLMARATALGRTVIAPLFGEAEWPAFQQVVRKGRADLALLALLEDLHVEGVWDGGVFDLYGHSGGAQFSHRFAMLYPHRVRRLTLGAAGWYTVPDTERFPLGLGRRRAPTEDWGPRMADGLSSFLRLPIQVYVGALDGQPDENTRRGPLIDSQQGTHRLARARHWYGAVREAATARGIEPRMDLMILPGAGHDFLDCIRNGALLERLLPDPSAGDGGTARAATA
ncbi:hypothetical protein [Roseospira navarrensis]|nr:hypothetical protein [Roseospira navarrensis]